MNPGNSTDEERERLLELEILHGDKIEPRTYKRVLVMCQRKASNLSKDVTKVAKAVSNIDTYIASNTPTSKHVKVSIEYLTYDYNEIHEAYADYMFELSRETRYDSSTVYDDKRVKLNKFIEDHNEYYDIIILNTCPLKWLDYDMIYNLLKPDGILVVKLFGNKESSPSKEYGPIIVDNIIRTIPTNLFIKQQGSLFGDITYIKHQASSLGMGKKLKKVYTRLKSRLRRLKETRRKKRKRRAIK